MKEYIYYWRKVRGDGNCYYRSIIVRYLEILILNGQIDLGTKNILLSGNAINLKSFIAQFVPNQLKGFLFLLFKDSSMDVEIDSKDQFLRINKIPFMSLQFFKD